MYRKSKRQMAINKYKLQENQKGFSLIEVLICIAILVLICVPLFSGFRLSADNNRRAHHTQKATAYAQETMETIKSIPVDQFEALIGNAVDGAGNPTGTVQRLPVDPAKRLEFDDPNIYPDELFEVIICRQEDINIGGILYDLEAEFNPVVYSQKKNGLNPDSTSSDANTYTSVNVNAIDGMKFPVISDEINRYEAPDGASASAVLYNLMAQATDAQLTLLGADTDARLLTIYQNTTKTVRVTINPVGTEAELVENGITYITNEIRVNCDVVYETVFGGFNLRQVYNVYSGTFELKGEKLGSTVSRWESGGNIFIFARAYQERLSAFSGQSLLANDIEIHNNYTGTGDLDIYLVEGRYSNGTGVHFNKVSIGTYVYATIPSSSDTYSGEAHTGKTRLHTNIKGQITRPDIAVTDPVETIGKDAAQLRCYEVVLTLTEQESGNVVAHLTTTKAVK